jgi:hypothetical protein
LKRINVQDCKQLKYIIGQSSHDDHQKHNKVHLRLPTLEHINVCNLPSLVAISSKQYRTTCPQLVEVELEPKEYYSQVAIKNFQNLIVQPISKSQVSLFPYIFVVF